MRLGSAERDLSSAELPRLLRQRADAFAFDEAIVPSATADDPDADAVDALARPTKRLGRDQLLENLQVLQLSEGVLRPTVAGLLAFGRSPTEHLPGAYVHAVVHRGRARASDELVHSEDVRGSVDRQVEGAPWPWSSGSCSGPLARRLAAMTFPSSALRRSTKPW